MFCKACGSELKPDAEFCGSCGADAKQTTAQSGAAPPPSPAPPKKRMGWKMKALIAFVGLGLLGGLMELIDPEASQKRTQERIEKKQAAAEERAARSEKEAIAKAAQDEANNAKAKLLLDAYSDLLRKYEVKMIESVSVRVPNTIRFEVTLTVDNVWHVRHKQIRMQDAQSLWKVWAGLASPAKPDRARIKLVDLNGNEVGGSRFLAGSSLWVQD